MHRSMLHRTLRPAVALDWQSLDQQRQYDRVQPETAAAAVSVSSRLREAEAEVARLRSANEKLLERVERLNQRLSEKGSGVCTCEGRLVVRALLKKFHPDKFRDSEDPPTPESITRCILKAHRKQLCTTASR